MTRSRWRICPIRICRRCRQRALRELAGKRALGYLNWTRNRHKYHRREVLDALVADMQAQRPDHIAVTGDLVNLALRGGIRAARGLARERRSAGHVTVIPGNHDAYVRATQHRFADAFGDYLRGDAGSERHLISVPAPARSAGADRRVLGGADGAVDGDRTARPRAARRARASCWRNFAGRGFPRAADPSSPALDVRMKRLTDSRGVAALLQRHGVELVLHGHDHLHSTMWLDGSARQDSRDRRAVGVSAGARPLSGRCLQSVFDRTRRRRMALRCIRVRGIDAACASSRSD